MAFSEYPNFERVAHGKINHKNAKAPKPFCFLINNCLLLRTVNKLKFSILLCNTFCQYPFMNYFASAAVAAVAAPAVPGAALAASAASKQGRPQKMKM